jgi:hypothetical protein
VRYQSVIVVEADGDDRAQAAALVATLIRHLGRTVDPDYIGNVKFGNAIMSEISWDPCGEPGVIAFWGGGRELEGSQHVLATVEDDGKLRSSL